MKPIMYTYSKTTNTFVVKITPNVSAASEKKTLNTKICCSFIKRTMHILIYIQQDATLHILFYLETALHVSGSTTTHHQERKHLYLQQLVFVTPFLLPAA
jgi:hypothetical protein